MSGHPSARPTATQHMVALAAALVIGGLTHARPAGAQTPSAPESETEPSLESDGDDTHSLDGFYMRVGVGAGGFFDRFESRDAEHIVDGHARGGAGAFDLVMGGSLGRGVMLGGMLLLDFVGEPETELEGLEIRRNIDIGSYMMLGPYLEWYPEQARSWRIQLGALAARMTIETDEGTFADHDPIGGALLVAGGREWWVADHWTLGITCRFTHAVLQDDQQRHKVTTVALMMTATLG